MDVEKKRRGHLGISIFILTVLLLLSFACFYYGCVGAIKDAHIKAINNKVLADVVDVTGGGGVDTSSKLRLVYYYKDENGVEYQGSTTHETSHEEAYALIGTKIEIYIDGKGGSVVASEGRVLWISVVLAIFFLLLAGFFLCFFLIPHDIRKKSSEQSK